VRGSKLNTPNQWMVAHGFVITELNYGACSGSCGPHFLQKLNHHFFLQNLYVRMSSFFFVNGVVVVTSEGAWGWSIFWLFQCISNLLSL
jgi:hypothetical protein